MRTQDPVTLGAGVLVLLESRILGGDSTRCFTGFYRQDDTAFKAQIEIQHFASEMRKLLKPEHWKMEGFINGGEIYASFWPIDHHSPLQAVILQRELFAPARMPMLIMN